MSVKQHSSGVWFYRFKIGKQQFRQQGFKSYVECVNAEAAKRTEAVRMVALGDSVNSNITLAEAADLFFNQFALPYRKNVATYRITIRRLIEFFGDRRLRDIQPRDIEAFIVHVGETAKGIKQEKVSGNTLNHYIAATKSIVNWCKKKRYYAGENPAWGVEMKKVPKAKVRYLLPDEEKRLTPVVAKNARLWPFYVTALHTGLRLGEVCAIRVRDIIRHPQPMIFIPNSKSSRSRYVPLYGLAMGVVADRLAGKAPEVRLFDHVNKTTVSLWFNEACREAQVGDHFTFHCLRHTFAAHMLTRGVPIYKVSKILGHSTTRVTEEHYGHLDRTELAKEIHHIDGVVNVPTLPDLVGRAAENAQRVNMGVNPQ